jgi:hypothetical protein
MGKKIFLNAKGQTLHCGNADGPALSYLRIGALAPVDIGVVGRACYESVGKRRKGR